MTVKYTSKRPDEQLDALQDLEEEWSDPNGEPEERIVIGRVRRHAISKNDGGDWQVTAALRHVEIVTGPDADSARELMLRAQEKRTGEAPLELPTIGSDDELPGEDPWGGDAA